MVVMDKQMTRRAWGWIAGLGTALVCLSTTVKPVVANPPLDLVTGGQSVAALKEDGLIYMQWGFQSLAIDSFRGAMSLEDRANTLPEQRDADVPFNLGLIYLNKGDLRGAKRAFERSLEADPTNFKTQYHLALVELQMGDEEAGRQRLQLLETAAVSDPQIQAHLQELIASLTPLPPAPEPDLADLAAQETLDPEEELDSEGELDSEQLGASASDPDLAADSTPEESSTLASEPEGMPAAPDLFSDEITGVVEFEPEEGAAVEAEAVETESEVRESGLSRFRRDD